MADTWKCILQYFFLFEYNFPKDPTENKPIWTVDDMLHCLEYTSSGFIWFNSFNIKQTGKEYVRQIKHLHLFYEDKRNIIISPIITVLFARSYFGKTDLLGSVF